MNVPKLRFPGFSGEWEVKKLGDIAQFSKGANISKGDIEVGGKTKAIRYGELYTAYSETINNVVSATNLPQSSLVFSRKNDVIIPASGETHIDIATASCVLNDGIALGGDLNIIRSENNGVFLSYYLNNAKKYDIAKLGQGVSVVHLYPANLKSLKLQLPDKAEQEKIAGFLTVVDERIAAMDEKVELLLQYKKGVMQKIFTQKLRFKDDSGNDYPTWRDMTLGDILIFARNGLSADQNNHQTGKKVTRIETISTGVVNLEKVGYIDTDADVSDYKLEVGDMLFSNINSPSQIGRTVYVDRDYNLYHGMNLLCLRVNVQNVSLYVYYLLSSRRYKQYFETICNKAVNQASINQTDLKRTKLTMPSKEEQQKIADFLISLDGKIKLEKTKLEQAKLFKKSLLQRIFV